MRRIKTIVAGYCVLTATVTLVSGGALAANIASSGAATEAERVDVRASAFTDNPAEARQRIDEDWEQAQRERRAAEEKRRRDEELRRQALIREKKSRYGLSWPHVDRITSHFGRRGRGYHHGMDIDCSPTGGERIYAAADGRVVTAGRLPVYGNAVIIQSGNGLRTLYGHMSRLYVRAGQSVNRGNTLGLCGSTGNSTGPHLHFEVYLRGVPVNPLHHLPAWT